MRNLIAKIIIGVSLLICSFSMFCWFGDALNINLPTGLIPGIYVDTYAHIGNVFNFMFGTEGKTRIMGQTNPSDITLTPILTVVFVLQMLVIIASIVVFVQYYKKKNINKVVLIVAFLALVCGILAVCSKKPMLEANDMSAIEDYAKLDSGIISYVVLSFVGAVGCIAGSILYKNK